MNPSLSFDFFWKEHRKHVISYTIKFFWVCPLILFLGGLLTLVFNALFPTNESVNFYKLQDFLIRQTWIDIYPKFIYGVFLGYVVALPIIHLGENSSIQGVSNESVSSVFFKDGRATWYGSWLAIIGSLLVMYGVIHFRLNNVFGWFLLVAAWIVLMVFGLSGRAEAIGLKPFTNDPLGWRKAKKTYAERSAENRSDDDKSA